MEDKDLLEHIVKALVDAPHAVTVERSVDEMGVLLCLTVAKDDMGKCIGKGGAMAKAIRTVMRGVGMKHNARVNVKVLEPSITEMDPVSFADATDVQEG